MQNESTKLQNVLFISNYFFSKSQNYTPNTCPSFGIHFHESDNRYEHHSTLSPQWFLIRSLCFESGVGEITWQSTWQERKVPNLVKIRLDRSFRSTSSAIKTPRVEHRFKCWIDNPDVLFEAVRPPDLLQKEVCPNRITSACRVNSFLYRFIWKMSDNFIISFILLFQLKT